MVTKWSPVALASATPVEKELSGNSYWLGLGPLSSLVPVTAGMGRPAFLIPHGLWVGERWFLKDSSGQVR